VKIVGATGLGGLWALEWEAQESACQIGYKNQITLQFSEHLVQGMKILNSSTYNKQRLYLAAQRILGAPSRFSPPRGWLKLPVF